MSHWSKQLKDFVKKKCKGILTISLTTMMVYNHVDSERVKREIEKLDNLKCLVKAN